METSIREMKNKAKANLKDQWGMLTVMELISSMLMNVASLLVGGALGMGLARATMDVDKGKNADILTLFNGFKDFVKVFVLYLVKQIFILLWSLLFIIPGIIKALSYSMCYFILNDSPDLTYDEALRRSVQMMKGNKGKLFRIYVSFIGWYILSFLTFGILMLFTRPYIRMTVYQFYKSIAPEQEIDATDDFVVVDDDKLTF
ncbi:MAG: DUF975 family protein [Clostridia bacterium]|nr:DUF975 family protein [Clostridia bacterium]MDE7337643.1 DUF975 family protein [Clostridia bacterium]